MKKSNLILSALISLSFTACLFDSEETSKVSASSHPKAKSFQNEGNYSANLSNEEIKADLIIIAGNSDEINPNETFNTNAKIKKSFRPAFPLTNQAENCQSMSNDLNNESTVGEKGSGLYSYSSVKYTAADGTSEMVVCQGQKEFSFRTILEQEEEQGSKVLSMSSNILTSGDGEDFTMSGDMSLEVQQDKFQASTFMLMTGDMNINQSNGQATGNMQYNGDFYFLQDKYRCSFEFTVDMSGQNNGNPAMNCDLTHNGEKVGSISGDKVLDIDGNTIK